MPYMVMKLIFGKLYEASPFFIKPISGMLGSQVGKAYWELVLEVIFALVDLVLSVSSDVLFVHRVWEVLVGKTLCTVSGTAGFLSCNLFLLLAVVGVNLVVGALFRSFALFLSLLLCVLLDLFLLLLGLLDLGTDTSVWNSIVRAALCERRLSVTAR
jgi:hypothetical protein